MPAQGGTAARRVTLIHGAATTSRVWCLVVPLLAPSAVVSRAAAALG